MLGTSRRFASVNLSFLAAAFLTAAPLFAQQSSQQDQDPVADAARKTREQKKDQAKPKKVYDDDNLPRAPRPAEQPTPAAQPGTADQAAQSGQPADAAPGAPDKNDEAAWRKRFKDQRDKIARAEKELDLLQREQEKAQLQYYPDPQKALMEQNSRKDINEKNAKIAAKQKELDALKQGLSDLEDQLRKTGGDSGWSRE